MPSSILVPRITAFSEDNIKPILYKKCAEAFYAAELKSYDVTAAERQKYLEFHHSNSHMVHIVQVISHPIEF